MGLHFAHSKSLIHRDVKPSNLLVAATGQVKLLDLGVATRIQESPSGEVVDAAVVGTLSYMAPEQRSVQSNLDARADIYGLGKTLIKLLAGRKLASSDLGIDSLPSDVPTNVRSLLSSMTATNPEDRPATADEVAKALAPHADRQDLIDFVTELFPNRVGSIIPSDEFPPLAESSMVNHSRRRWIGAAAAVSIAVGLAAFWRPAAGTKKSRWRTLSPADEELLFSAGDPEATFELLEDQRIEIRSSDISLLRLGQPLRGTFSFNVVLHPQNCNSCGVFFQGRGDQKLSYYTIEIGQDLNSETQPAQMVWTWWIVGLSNPNKPQVQRQILATAPIDPTAIESRVQLQITCGRRHMPEVRINGDPLPHASWDLTVAGRLLQKIPAAQLSTTFLGDLGLVNVGGLCVFERPRLAYQ